MRTYVNLCTGTPARMHVIGVPCRLPAVPRDPTLRNTDCHTRDVLQGTFAIWGCRTSLVWQGSISCVLGPSATDQGNLKTDYID